MAGDVTLTSFAAIFLRQVSSGFKQALNSAQSFDARSVQPVSYSPEMGPYTANRSRQFNDFCYTDGFLGTDIVFVDPMGLQKEPLRWLGGACVSTRVSVSLEAAGCLVTMKPGSVGLVLVDLASCGGIAKTASSLLQFRKVHPDIPVILISAESAVDDFSTERLAVADVTLRTPLSVSRLDLALAESQINNQVWQNRMRSLRPH